MEKEKFKDFWTKAHTGIVVHNPTRSLEGIRPLESYKNNFTETHANLYCKDLGYKAFNNGGVFGNGPAFDVVMFSTMF